MTQDATGITTDGRMAVCLSEIDGFEYVTARMPTPDECRDYKLCGDAPVLVMRRRGREQLYAADMVKLTVDSGLPPDPDAVRDAARYVFKCVLEDLDNVRATIADLASAREAQKIIRLADECRQERTAELIAAGT